MITFPLPPIVPGPPVLGSIVALSRDATGFFVENYEKLGPIFRVKVYKNEYTVIAGPEARHFLLTVGEKYFSRRAFYKRFAEELGADNFVLGAQGEQHARLREIMALAFSRQVAAIHIRHLVEAIQREASAWKPGQRLSVMEMTAALAFEQYGLLMTHRSLKDHFKDAMVYANTVMRVVIMVSPAWVLHLPGYRNAKRRIFSLMRQSVNEHRSQGPGEHQEPDIIDTLLTVTDREGRTLSEAEVISSALYGFVGTLVYTNRVLSFLLYELLRNPELLEQATDEADAVFASGPPDIQMLPRMRVLYGAYLESLRFHPIALGLPYCAEQDFEFAGYGVRKGQNVVISPVPIHFSTRFYSNPQSFDAARCTEPRNEHRSPGAFVPFGFGMRTCAAAGLVEIITMSTVATLLRTVHLQLEPPAYKLKTTLDPLPGPETKFRVRVVEQRPSAIMPGRPLPDLAEAPSALLSQLSPQQLEQLLSRVKTVTYPAGTVIIHQGDIADAFFIIVVGEVEVLKEEAKGETRLLSRLKAGDYFGEIGLLQGVRRTATVRATADTAVKVLRLDRETFTQMVSESDFVAGEIARVIQRRSMATRLSEVLPKLSVDQVSRFLPDLVLMRYDPGATIIQQGEPAEKFYIITRGRVEVLNHRAGGQDVVLGELGSGEWFGEIGLLLGCSRTATVRAKLEDEVQVMALDKENFARLIAESAGTREDLAMVMCQRIISSLEKLNAVEPETH
jgi:CRP-like cAMP-binding protein/cytochrome P450